MLSSLPDVPVPMVSALLHSGLKKSSEFSALIILVTFRAGQAVPLLPLSKYSSQ